MGHKHRRPSSNTPSVPREQPLYFINAVVDTAVIGGVSVAVFAALRCCHPGERTQDIITAAAFLTWIINWPHFSATAYRLYHSRTAWAQYPVTALVTPVLLAAAVAGSVAWPTTMAPAFAKVFLIWSPYHFSGQTVGISLLYARRAGIKVDSKERSSLFTFVYLTFLYPTILSEVGLGTTNWYTIDLPALGMPAWTADLAQALLWFSGVVFLLLLARRAWSRELRWPLIALVPPLAQLIWFVIGSGTASFTEFVPFFHGLQYLLIAWAMQLGERVSETPSGGSPAFVVSETTRWGLINLCGGFCLFYALPQLLARTGVPSTFATGVVIAAVQIHHFIVDGVIWKLRKSSVSSPLMTDIRSLAGVGSRL